MAPFLRNNTVLGFSSSGTANSRGLQARPKWHPDVSRGVTSARSPTTRWPRCHQGLISRSAVRWLPFKAGAAEAVDLAQRTKPRRLAVDAATARAPLIVRGGSKI